MARVLVQLVFPPPTVYLLTQKQYSEVQGTKGFIAMDGIDHLLNLLVIVKSKGLDAAFAEDFSDGRQRSRNDNFEHYPKPLCTFRRSLEDWKLCLAALEGFM
ncbi:hypothetical protein BD410DRAFT_832467, partial [Rickenella mellea]